jgi:hypothetical protein
MNSLNVSTTRVLLILSILLAFASGIGICEEQGDISIGSAPNSSAKKIIEDREKATETPLEKRIKIVSGEVVIDGSLKALEPIYGKVFDLVETSTPVTPAPNHVRIFAVAIGTATAVKAIYDDGRILVINNN